MENLKLNNGEDPIVMLLLLSRKKMK